MERSLTANRFLSKVYGWMTLSVLVSFLTSYLFSTTPLFRTLEMSYASHGIAEQLLISIALLAVEWIFMGFVFKEASNNPTLAKVLLLGFSAFDGATISGMLAFMPPDITVGAFAFTTFLFACMSITGFAIKKDLSFTRKAIGGAILAFIVITFLEFFIHTPLIMMVMSAIGVVLFAVATLLDTNSIMQSVYNGSDSDGMSVVGALQLYLDFINMFVNIAEFMWEMFGNN